MDEPFKKSEEVKDAKKAWNKANNHVVNCLARQLTYLGSESNLRLMASKEMRTLALELQGAEVFQEH